MDLKHEIMKHVMDTIRHHAGTGPDAQEFIRELQSQIQEISGASVAFASRDVDWLKDGYLEGRKDLSDQDLQSLLVSAANSYDEVAASQDGITYVMTDKLDEIAPADEHDGPDGP